MKPSNHEIATICGRLREVLERAVNKNLADGILLSGGLDTSIVALLASRFKQPRAFTVALKASHSPDLEYAERVAGYLGLRHDILLLDPEEIFPYIRETIRILETFDATEIRNSVAIYSGLRYAKDEGVGSIMTGDGGDELFAGYSFLFDMDRERLKEYLIQMCKTMSFSSIPLGKALGVEVKIPFLDPEVKSLALEIGPDLKVKNRQGKWILREAFRRDLPREIIERIKTPIEYGSGTTEITALIEKRIPDREYEEKREEIYRREGIQIQGKEQLLYYEIFRSLGIKIPKEGEKNCPRCGYGLPSTSHHCRICGAYPI